MVSIRPSRTLSALTAAAALVALAVVHGAPASAAPGIKPYVAGAINREGPAATSTDVVDDFVIKVAWKDIQSDIGAPINPGVLDEALEDAGNGRRVRLRFLAGADTPAAIKQKVGTVTLTDSVDDNPATAFPKWWSPTYQQAYADVMQQLAARYDRTYKIADVTVSGCMTFYAEPMIRQAGDADNRTRLLAAGYTRAGDLACHSAALQAHAAWTTTASSLAANPYQWVKRDGTPDGEFVSSVPDALSLLKECRTVLGARCVLQNNSLRPTFTTSGTYKQLYDGMFALGGPIGFQTATLTKLQDPAQGPHPIEYLLDWAADKGAITVELPGGWQGDVDPTVLRQQDLRLEANARAL